MFPEHAATFASGLRVPKPYGDYHHPRHPRPQIRRHRRRAAPTKQIFESIAQRLGKATKASFLSPEGAAATAAYDQLLATGELKPTDKVVLFNTGAGLKYTDMTADAMHLKRPGSGPKLPTSLPVGGIITPI